MFKKGMRYGEREGMNPFEGGKKDKSEEGRKGKRKKTKRMAKGR
jgi:hypothetical protein